MRPVDYFPFPAWKWFYPRLGDSGDLRATYRCRSVPPPAALPSLHTPCHDKPRDAVGSCGAAVSRPSIACVRRDGRSRNSLGRAARCGGACGGTARRPARSRACDGWGGDGWRTPARCSPRRSCPRGNWPDLSTLRSGSGSLRRRSGHDAGRRNPLLRQRRRQGLDTLQEQSCRGVSRADARKPQRN